MDFMVISNFSPSPGIGWKKSHIFPMHPNAFSRIFSRIFPKSSYDFIISKIFPHIFCIFFGLKLPVIFTSFPRSSHDFPRIFTKNPMISCSNFSMIFPWFSPWFPYGYGSIPIDTFLVGWTSIYQLFWGSRHGTRVLTHPHFFQNPTCLDVFPHIHMIFPWFFPWFSPMISILISLISKDVPWGWVQAAGGGESCQRDAVPAKEWAISVVFHGFCRIYIWFIYDLYMIYMDFVDLIYVFLYDLLWIYMDLYGFIWIYIMFFLHGFIRDLYRR